MAVRHVQHVHVRAEDAEPVRVERRDDGAAPHVVVDDVVRHDPHAEPGEDRLPQEQEVLGDERRFEQHLVPLVAEVRGHPQLPADHRRRDDGRVEQLAELGRHPVRRGEAGRRARDVAHRAHVARDEVLRRLGHHAHRDVDFVAHQILDAVLEHDVEHDPRIEPLERDQPVRHHELPVAARHRQPHAPLQVLAERRHRLARGEQLALNAPAVLVQAQPDLGRLDAPRRAAHELQPDRLLQLVEPVADVRAAHLEPLRRLAEIARVEDVDEQRERIQIHRRARISKFIVKTGLTGC
ncbi:transcriptional regulator, LysR family domain protein [Burkholderia pseudomallei MSHR435]|nr:transcriptional regulator, LysR family domain protein [Burkholderia pseudomallei MSHR449]KGX77066.1 transcriptional regulator, LysR family domain protein [Burkholderia pseudomallei MSHR435]